MKTNKKAFTLIEVLIVVFILGIIITLFAAMITKETDEKISQLQQQVEEYQQIIDSYKEDN